MRIGASNAARRRRCPACSPSSPAPRSPRCASPGWPRWRTWRASRARPQYPLAIERATWQGEPVVAVVAETRAQAEDALALVEVDWESLPAVTRHRDRAGPRHAGDPPRAGRQPVLPAHAGHRRRGRRLRPPRRGGVRGDLPLRPPHRRDAGAALPDRRLEPGRQQAHRLPLVPGPAHDAGPVLPAVRPAGAAGARGLPRRGRVLRHQGARLPGRLRDRGLVDAAAAAGEVRRRPAGELRLRHPCAQHRISARIAATRPARSWPSRSTT
jgi:hypothetical protein